MKKKIIISAIAVVVVLLIFFIYFFCFWLNQDAGTINLTVNGKPVNLNNIEIARGDDSGINPDKRVICNNQFSFKGLYYWNYFSFTIPADLLDGYDSNIQVNFETLNANWWHHVIHTLDIDVITSGSEKCTLDITYTKLLPITDIGGIRFNEKTSESLSVTLTAENSSVSICDVMQ